MWYTARSVKRVLWIAGLLVIVASIGVAWGQSVGGEPGGRPEAGRGPQRPPQGPGGFGGPQAFGPGPGGFMGFGPLELLRRQDVRKELELLDEQVQQLAGLEEKQRNAMFDSLRRFNDRIAKGDRMPRREPGDAGRPRDPGNAGPPPDPRASFEQSNQALRNELSQILLPHQLKRLDQLQMQMRMRGGTMALFGREVAQELGITDDQREQLRPQVEGIERETQRKIAEIRRQAQQQVISLLSPDQQAKFRDLVGDPFEFANEPPPPQGPPPGSGPGPRGPARNP